jgi:hypothetical protein
LGSTCDSSLFDGCAGFVGIGVPEPNSEDVELLHAPKPPDDGVTKEDEAGDSNEICPKVDVDVDPNAGCPKAGVAFVPKPVWPNPKAGFGVSFGPFGGEGSSSLALFQLENAPKPGLIVGEPKTGAEDGWVATLLNKLPWIFP